MKNTNEVSYKKLKYTCNPDIFNFWDNRWT